MPFPSGLHWPLRSSSQSLAALIYVRSTRSKPSGRSKRSSDALDGAVDRVDATTAQIEPHLELAAASGPRLEASLARLAARARAERPHRRARDVRDSVDRVTAFMPRK